MKVTRLDIVKAQIEKGRPVSFGLPDIDAGRYLIDAMMCMGPTRSNGMGEVPTDWDIILPFAQATERVSEPWEMETLADMCVGYCRAKEDGANPLAIAPVEQG